MSLLSTEHLSVRFGGVVALNGLSITVEAGEVLGLIGPNGAGKTTFLDAVTGFVTATGTVRLDGHDISTLAPHRRSRLGIARTFQQVELFADLTVAEHLAVVRRRHRAKGTVDEPTELFGLDEQLHLMDRLPGELSHGQQRLVGCARALIARPRVLLLDEPAAGLDSTESAALIEPLRRVAASGVAVVLIDHDVDLVLSTADRVCVLNFGELIAVGPPEEIRRSPAVIEVYLGDPGEVTAVDEVV